jgi:hypothetical protein
MTRWASAALASSAWLVAGCPSTHHAPCDLGSCPEGYACDSSLEGDVCVERCTVLDVIPFTSLCDDGAACYWRPGGDRCAAGGSLGIGAVVDPFSEEACAFGLLPRPDYTSDPLVQRCVLGCSDELPCPTGDLCTSSGCMPLCVAGTAPCGPGNTCIMLGGYPECVNPRRLARIDCDGDGDADCHPAFVCDASAVGGCEHPPPEDL